MTADRGAIELWDSTGDLVPLDATIPELIGPGLATRTRKQLKGVASPAGFEPASPT